jgi:outer membrane protein OmpA-like peptidoglycan-associated protein
MGCDSSESILAVQSWDPERLVHAFPKTVSYGTSALSAGLRGAADDVAALDGKTIILVIGAGIESCKTDPIQIAEQICRNNPDLEIHTFQVGNQPEGAHFLKGIAAKGHGAYSSSDSTGSPAGWHAWMKKYLVQPCAARPTAPGRETSAAVGMITFDNNSFSVRSKEPSADAANLASLQAAANAMRGNPAARLALHGFSDGKGSAEQNLKLSRKRAEAAAQFLISSYGLPPNRISIVAHGPSAPGAPRPQGPSERMGRRVEFEIIQ